MDVFSHSSPGCDPQASAAPIAGPGVPPAPDYGPLGPGSDVPAGGLNSAPRLREARPLVLFLAVALGMLLIVLTGKAGSSPVVWSHFSRFFSARAAAPSAVLASAPDSRQLDRLKPQGQAEALLEL